MSARLENELQLASPLRSSTNLAALIGETPGGRSDRSPCRRPAVVPGLLRSLLFAVLRLVARTPVDNAIPDRHSRRRAGERPDKAQTNCTALCAAAR